MFFQYFVWFSPTFPVCSKYLSIFPVRVGTLYRPNLSRIVYIPTVTKMVKPSNPFVLYLGAFTTTISHIFYLDKILCFNRSKHITTNMTKCYIQYPVWKIIFPSDWLPWMRFWLQSQMYRNVLAEARCYCKQLVSVIISMLELNS